MTEIRWATASDIDTFYGKRPPQTVRALVIDVDGELIACGGITKDKGQNVAFMDLKPGALDHKKALIRAIHMAKKELVLTSEVPVYSIADSRFETAKGMLEHYGFTQISDEVFKWQG